METQPINKKSGVFKIILSIAVIVAIGLFFYQVILYQIFPSLFRTGLIAGIGLVVLLLLVALFQNRSKGLQVFSATSLILMLAIFAFGDYYLINTTSSLSKMSAVGSETTAMSLVALKDYEGSTRQELSAATTLMAMDQDRTHIQEYVKNLQDEMINLKEKTTTSYIDSARGLLANEGELMILNEAYRSLIEEVLPEFAEKTKVIQMKENVVTVPETEKTEAPVTEEPENPNAVSVFLSGIDTYGSLYNVARSDVNIVVSLNGDTKKAQILSIPRDSYVPIAGLGNDQRDKLTHAGIYGVDSSVKTLENLLDTSIPYYFRVNFSSFEYVIDTIGGITVNNPADFSAGGYYFSQGEIEMSGAKALSFVRERYTLSEGDLSRAKNQSLVIEAIINKMLQPEQLLALPTLMDTLSGSIDTNMTVQEMMRYANLQIEKPGRWEIERALLRGTGTYGLPSYAMPGWDLYMYQIDEASLREVQQEIKDLKR